ncbi:hypothetical protein V8C35DRAFT_312500 [Trichoderma chlorosporum]
MAFWPAKLSPRGKGKKKRRRAAGPQFRLESASCYSTGSRTTAVALGSSSLPGLAGCRPPHAKALDPCRNQADGSPQLLFLLPSGARASCHVRHASWELCVWAAKPQGRHTPSAEMLSYALLGIIINHPSPAPPHQALCLYAVRCCSVLRCAVPNPLPPSAACLVWSRHGRFGALPVWL